jgi:hypothetical protein
MHTTNALFTLGFPMAPPSKDLACSMHTLVGSFFNRHAVTDINTLATHPLRLLVSIRFQFYFTPLSGVLFTFPSRY